MLTDYINKVHFNFKKRAIRFRVVKTGKKHQLQGTAAVRLAGILYFEKVHLENQVKKDQEKSNGHPSP